MLVDSILQAIGGTPLVPLKRVGAHLDCNLYAKCEFMNPGGSVKDRIAHAMIEEAEKSGRIKPGDTLIEPTSGNTGIGLALAGAVKGYNIIITMPEKMSHEKQVILEALGAKIIRTPTEAAWDDPESHIGVANTLQAQLPNAHILDQYSNEFNPKAHFQHTAEEILQDLQGQVDMVVIGAGTGGTITGVAKRVKQACPNCIVVGADPVGSILAGGEEVGSYKVEGIGYDFIPRVLQKNLVDRWVKTTDKRSFVLARELIRREGLLCGGSSGAVLYATLQEAVKLGVGQNCVMILADGVRNYMTKFVDPQWMVENNFSLELTTVSGVVGDMVRDKPRSAMVTIEYTERVPAALERMRKHGFSQLPVTESGKLVGMIAEQDMLDYFLVAPPGANSPLVAQLCHRNVQTVDPATPIVALHKLLMSSQSVVLVDDQQIPVTILTKIDLVEWLSKKEAP
ncbi:MAG: cystathionine beta-synthase [Zetaproteobacteria bacterium]|nr:cystathionine beta-synthase [Zetaproteobacteria bacterium]